MKKIRNKNLFTLLEVLVSMGVFSLLMLALMQFFSAAQGVWEKSGSKAELFDSARIASQLLTDDLTSAFYGDENHDMSQYKFYQSSSSRLTFATQRSGGLTEVDYNWNQIDSEAEFDEWWTNISDMALYKRDVDIHYGDEIIVLSTCAYQVEDGRFAVVGVRCE